MGKDNKKDNDNKGKNEDKRRAAVAIAASVQNAINFSRSAAPADVAPAAPKPNPPASPSSSKNKNDGEIKIGGKTFNIGKTANSKDIEDIQKKLPNVSLAAIQSRLDKKNVNISPGAKTILTKSATNAENTTSAESNTSAGGNTDQELLDLLKQKGILDDTGKYVGAGSSLDPGEELISAPTFDFAKLTGALNIQREGALERLKYEVDNKIPLVQAEAKGKIDIQKIINAGYENMENIKRGSDMVRNITSMFNF